MIITDEIKIVATASKIWETLTVNKYVKQFMFSCEIDTDWNVNSDIVYYVQQNGSRITVVTGKILAIKPPYFLHHTLFPVGAKYPNIPENHIYVKYEIKENDNYCLLKVEQGGYERVADGEKRYKDSLGGWKKILPQVKALAEK